MTELTHAPETKATGPVADAYDALARTFTAFRETNDERLGQIERRMVSDGVTEDKLIRLDRAVDDALRNVEALSLKSRRPALGGEAREMTGAREHKSAFNAYVRGGETDALLRFEAKSISGGLAGPDGGYLVPQIVEREILRRMASISPIRAIATVRPVSTGTFKKAYAADGITAGWSDANVAITGQTQQLSDIVFPTFELYAQPAAT
ncbi:MAG: phage major capsid protein, partial [Proteobacteria bacterium]|nr:phage major capsid protein [Pseudomonadota bacterium]